MRRPAEAASAELDRELVRKFERARRIIV